MPCKVWGELTYPIPNFSNHWNLGMDKKFHFIFKDSNCDRDISKLIELSLIIFVRPNRHETGRNAKNLLNREAICHRAYCCRYGKNTLHGSHNGSDDVSNHQPHDCWLNHLFRRRSKKTPKLRVTGLCAGNSPVTGEYPAQMVSNAENVSI